jgi:23S rRNA pseudouridine2605 synthase
MKPERLQKILARGGLASRRAAEQLILEGRVRVNGRVVTELGAKADPRHDRVEVDGKRVVAEPPVYYALNKPRGYVTTMDDPEGRPSIRTLLQGQAIPARVFPVGRLDFHTSGLLLITNDGEFSDGLLHPRKEVPKTYVVKVQGKMEPEDIEKWREGVELEDGKTLPADAHFLRGDAERKESDKTWFEITIREGRNQQIRRMGEATGFPVMRLSRVSFAGVSSEGLKPGELRPLRYDELVALKKEYGVPKSPGVAREAPSLNESRRRLIRHARQEKDAVLTRAPRADRGESTEARPPSARSFRRPAEEAPGASEGAAAPRGRGGLGRPRRQESYEAPVPREERAARPFARGPKPASRDDDRPAKPFARGPKPAPRGDDRPAKPFARGPRPAPRGAHPERTTHDDHRPVRAPAERDARGGGRSAPRDDDRPAKPFARGPRPAPRGDERPAKPFARGPKPAPRGDERPAKPFARGPKPAPRGDERPAKPFARGPKPAPRGARPERITHDDDRPVRAPADRDARGGARPPRRRP